MLARHMSSTRERDRDCCGGVATSSLAVVTAAGEAPQTLKSADGGPCTTHDLPRIGRRRMHVRLVAQRLVGMNDATACPVNMSCTWACNRIMSFSQANCDVIVVAGIDTQAARGSIFHPQ